MQIAYNRTNRTEKPKYIVIHDTGNKSKGANAMAHYNYFNGANRGSSADIFVDDKEALQVNDYNKYYTWHCGDGKGKYGITNANSVGIEICVNSDGNYDKAVKNAVKVTKELMKKLSIPVENVVRHYDASRKNCPASMSANNWKSWQNFKEMLLSERFKDVKGHYAENAINDLFDMGIVNGDGNGNYMPDDKVTRGDVAIIVRNAIRFITGK